MRPSRPRARAATGVRSRYLRRVSGPLLDRFDLRLGVRRPAVDELLGGPRGEPSAAVAGRVRRRPRAGRRARRVPQRRHPGRTGSTSVAPLSPSAPRLLRRELETQPARPAAACTGSGGSARTLADLQAGAARDVVDDQFIALALDAPDRSLRASCGRRHERRPCPPRRYAAALAAIPPLGPTRLARLLPRWSPDEAWAAPSGAAGATAVWSAGEPAHRLDEGTPLPSAAARRPGRPGAALGALPRDRRRGARRRAARLPGRPRRRPVAAARAVRRGATSAPSTAGGSRSSAPATPRPPAARSPPSSGRAWPRPACGVVSGLARGIDGWAHRGALAGRGRRAADRRSWPAGSTSSTRPSTAALWQEVVERGPAAQRGAARHAAGRLPLPAAQPHPGRAGRGGRRGRVARHAAGRCSPSTRPSTAASR